MVARRRTVLLACLVLAVLSSAACHPCGRESQLVQADAPRLESPNISASQLAQLAAGTHAFAFDLYRAATVTDRGNLVYSPYSVSLLFSTIYAGATVSMGFSFFFSTCVAGGNTR